VANERAIVDAGPLVALLNAKDVAHSACSEAVVNLAKPLASSWAVLAEAAWLLRNTHDGLQRLMRLVSDGIVECPPLDAAAADWIADHAQRYADLKPQLADLTLLYLAQQANINLVFTLDRRDFQVFRNRENKPFRLIPENWPISRN
jgi:predicted nucleic acid-binding protein